MTPLAPPTMNAEALARELNDLLATETRSLLRHAHGSTPHVSAKTYKYWMQIQSLAQHTADHAHRLSDLLDRLELPERTRPFPTVIASFHYMTVDSLVPLLLDEKRRQIAAYDRAIRHAGREQAVIDELQRLLADNQTQLDQLEQIHTALSPATSGPIDYTRTADPNNAANAALAHQLAEKARHPEQAEQEEEKQEKPAEKDAKEGKKAGKKTETAKD